MAEPRRLLTVSNRGPVEFHFETGGADEDGDERGELVAVSGSGGLSTAMSRAATLYPMTWLSNALTPADRLIASGALEIGSDRPAAHFVTTDPDQYDLFYGTFSNEVLWFLQHGQPWPEELEPADIEHSWRQGYVPINRAVADAVIAELDGGDFRAVMLHDYHFYLVPAMVRESRPGTYLQHFIHIPWPGPSQWSRLDKAMMASICKGMLGNDSLVFQTRDSQIDFLATCEEFLPEATVDREAGRVSLNDGAGRETRVWANGISVEPAELEAEAESAQFSEYRYLLRPNPGEQTIIRVDRLDPTKNVIRGFEAYECLLEDHPELLGKVNFLALLVPSKAEIESYRRYQDETHALIDQINAKFSRRHWQPIQVFYENNRTQALAAMSLYDVMLVNSLADGMNLVAKEGPTLNRRDGVLVLSKSAGAYADLSAGSIGIDPEDVQETAAALYTALTMAPSERRDRARQLRQAVRQHDLGAWLKALMDDIEQNSGEPAEL